MERWLMSDGDDRIDVVFWNGQQLNKRVYVDERTPEEILLLLKLETMVFMNELSLGIIRNLN